MDKTVHLHWEYGRSCKLWLRQEKRKKYGRHTCLMSYLVASWWDSLCVLNPSTRACLRLVPAV
jgi:hypothetical protein